MSDLQALAACIDAAEEDCIDRELIAGARRQVARMLAALRRIQELATDTPEPECYETALNAIVEVCEDTLETHP